MTIATCEAYLAESIESAAAASWLGLRDWRDAFIRRSASLRKMPVRIKARPVGESAMEKVKRLYVGQPVAARIVEVEPSESWVSKPIIYKEPE